MCWPAHTHTGIRGERKWIGQSGLFSYEVLDLMDGIDRYPFARAKPLAQFSIVNGLTPKCRLCHIVGATEILDVCQQRPD